MLAENPCPTVARKTILGTFAAKSRATPGGHGIREAAGWATDSLTGKLSVRGPEASEGGGLGLTHRATDFRVFGVALYVGPGAGPGREAGFGQVHHYWPRPSTHEEPARPGWPAGLVLPCLDIGGKNTPPPNRANCSNFSPVLGIQLPTAFSRRGSKKNPGDQKFGGKKSGG